MNAHVDFPKELREFASEVTCFFCWPRLSMTGQADHKGRPICEACAKNPHRRMTMPRFVLRFQEARHD